MRECNLEHTQYSHFFKRGSTNTHIHTRTHIYAKKYAYLELHDEMCEMEFGLQVQSDADILLSCGGYITVTQSHNNTIDAQVSSATVAVCLTE